MYATPQLSVCLLDANISIRENGGRRAIDMLHSKCSQASKSEWNVSTS